MKYMIFIKGLTYIICTN